MKQAAPWLWISWFWIGLVLFPACGTAATNIVGFHLQEQEKADCTVLVLDLDGPVGVQFFSLDSPDRVVVDLTGAHITHPEQLHGIQSALLRRIRASTHANGELRIVLDVPHPLWARNYFSVEGKITHLVIELRDSGVPPQATSLSSKHAALSPPPLVPTPMPVKETVNRSHGSTLVPVAQALKHEGHAISSVPAVSSVGGAIAPSPLLPPQAVADHGLRQGVSQGLSQPMPSVSARSAEASPAIPIPSVGGTPWKEEQMPVVGQKALGREIVVAVDPGHGGKDPGTTGHGGTEEKDVTLTIARYVVEFLRKEPGIHPILTRRGDYFVPLRERIQKARLFKADLFISIHADAAPDSSVTGASVYVLSEKGASSEAARMLAEQENAVDLVGGVHLKGRDNNLTRTLLDMSQNATREASAVVAKRLLSSMDQIGDLSRDTVERAGFLVLKSPDIPSVLVETAYLSNPEEEKKLNDPNYQQTIARALARGIRTYFVHSPPAGTVLAQTTETPPTELVRR